MLFEIKTVTNAEEAEEYPINENIIKERFKIRDIRRKDMKNLCKNNQR